MDSHLTPEVRGLVAGPVPTRMHVDVLLLLRRFAPDVRTADELARLLGGCGAGVVQRCLVELVDAGLVERTAEGRYRYLPATGSLRRGGDAVARLRDTRPLMRVRVRARRAAIAGPPKRNARVFPLPPQAYDA